MTLYFECQINKKRTPSGDFAHWDISDSVHSEDKRWLFQVRTGIKRKCKMISLVNIDHSGKI